MVNETKGLKRLVFATGYSIKGFKSAWIHEEAFRQESVIVALLLPIGLWIGNGPIEKCMLVLPLFIILLAELVNSAIEAAIDRIGPERHELSGRAKDIGSAAVFVSLTLAGLIWGIILWGKL